MMHRRRYLASVATGAGLALSGCTGLQGDTTDGGGAGGENGDQDGQSSQYPTKNINWINPNAAGGSKDTFNRGIVPHWEEELPGEAKIVVRNDPSGAGIPAVSQVYNSKEGYTVGSGSFPGFLNLQFERDVQFDMREMTWLSWLFSTYNIFTIRSDIEGIQDVSDLKNLDSNLKMGMVEGTSSALILETLINELDLDMEVVYGFNDGPSTFSSIKRGEIDGTQYSVGFSKGPIQEGWVEPWIYTGPRDLMTEEAPYLEEFADQIGTSRELGSNLDMPFSIGTYTSPGLKEKHPDRYNTMLESLKRAVTREEVKTDAYDPQGYPHNPIFGDEVKQKVTANIDFLESQ